MRFRLILFLLFSGFIRIHGQDSIPVLERVENRLSLVRDFIPFTWNDPALAGYIRTYSLIDMNIRGEIEDNKNQLPQLGAGYRQGAFCADAQVLLKNKDLIWGTASYENGTKKNVQWNESADFLKVYPYVSIDTVGGDLKYENYLFEGGYSKQYDRFSWGISAGFRERMEFRNQDPRPKNTISDLYTRLAGSFFVSPEYVLAANLNLGKYKQSNQVSSYSELGSIPIYNAIGLGLLNNRFWDKSASNHFSGSTYGGSLSLIPSRLSGWYAQANYNYSRLGKLIENPSRIDLNRTVTNEAGMTLAYLRKSGIRHYGLNISASYYKRLGYESIVGDVSKGEYQILGENQPYQAEHKTISISGLLEKTGNISWSLQPEVQAGRLSAAYSTPHRLMEVAYFRPGLNVSAIKKSGKSMIALCLKGLYHVTNDEKLEISENTSGSTLEIRQSIDETYRSLTSNYTGATLNVRYYYSLGISRALYIHAGGGYRWYEQGLPGADFLTLAIGSVF